MKARTQKYNTFDNPAGFIEQHFLGVQSADSVIAAVEELVRRAKKLKINKQHVFILVDVSDVPKIDVSGKMSRARKEAIKAMKDADYDKIAVYGDTALQIMVNTLALIAGKRDKIRVFASRVEALKWLKS
ncbi:MAG TPA: STAS/SEC14 domain-containing protein [Candidatus Saccharimonadales bacterium]|nr:STAS/SEC14 domain-containing protein [Candidatus Saccharimonadales bacterium]